MSRLEKLKKRLAELDPSFTAKEDRGTVVLTGESDDWQKIVRAGKLAVDKKRYLGVVNRIRLKGFEQRTPDPIVRDKALDGAAPDVLVIGGGIVGCAAARALRRYDISVMLAERGYDVALGGSSRNGGVVHVGINYSPHAQKHIYNNRGNAMYEGLCRDLGVPFEQKGQVLLIGKRWEKLLCTVLALNAKRLHIPGVKFMKREELLSVEPHIPEWIYGGLYMPTGGITSPYQMTVALAENAVTNGARICLNTVVEGMDTEDGKIRAVYTNRGVIRPKLVINAAGVYSDVIADMAGDRTFTVHPRKGTDIIMDKKKGYMVRTSMAKSPTTVPSVSGGAEEARPGGLKAVIAALHSHTKGIASIHTADGNMIIGPDALEVPDREDTSTTAESMDAIFDAQSRISEGVGKQDVIAYFAGVRAPTYEEDFVVRKGIFTENILEAAGIQSPGITAAPAIAEDLAEWAAEYLAKFGKVRRNPSFDPVRKKRPCLREMTEEERAALIAERPDYGEIVCRCEEVSKGEILDALRSPLPVYTVDAVKRRVRPGMGRCQGGFCSPLVVKIIAEETGMTPEEVTKGNARSNILFGDTKHPGEQGE